MNDRKPCALIIDDDPGVRKILVRLFACSDWDATAFVGREDAMEGFSPGAFELALCDVNLGENQDGLMIARELAALDPSLRVVLMSGDLRQIERARAASLRLVIKPFDALAIYRLCDWAKSTPERAEER